MNRMIMRAAKCGVLRAPVVVVEHNDFLQNNNIASMHWMKWMLLRREISFLYRRAAAVVGCGVGVAEQWQKVFGLKPDKVHAIRNPLDRKFVNVQTPPPKVLGEIAGLPRPWLISAGRLVEQKGFEDLIGAFSLVGRGSLIVIGEGPQRSRLSTLIAQRGLQGRVMLPGFIDNPEHILRAADLCVSSSRWEGYPLMLVEAYASGLPVVARDCDFGPREIVTPDRPGILVKDLSIDALADAICSALERFPRFAPGTTVDLSENDPSHVATCYRALFN
jgi:glycosyltransferase involved in cell wall biosynthesis